MKEAQELREHAKWYREHGHTQAAINCEAIADEIEARGYPAPPWVYGVYTVAALLILGSLVVLITHLFLPQVR
jgi:hypothetical protein